MTWHLICNEPRTNNVRKEHRRTRRSFIRTPPKTRNCGPQKLRRVITRQNNKAKRSWTSCRQDIVSWPHDWPKDQLTTCVSAQKLLNCHHQQQTSSHLETEVGWPSQIVSDCLLMPPCPSYKQLTQLMVTRRSEGQRLLRFASTFMLSVATQLLHLLPRSTI